MWHKPDPAEPSQAMATLLTFNHPIYLKTMTLPPRYRINKGDGNSTPGSESKVEVSQEMTPDTLYQVSCCQIQKSRTWRSIDSQAAAGISKIAGTVARRAQLN